MTIGERIKQRREELGWSQRDLAREIGYTNHSTITKIESDEVSVNYAKILQFADVLDTTVGYLMGYEEIKPILNIAIMESWKHGFSLQRLSRAMDLPEETLYSKLTGVDELTVREAKQLKAIIGSELPLEILFGVGF